MNLRERNEQGIIKIALFESYCVGDEDAIIPIPFDTTTTATGYLYHARNTISIIRKFIPNAEIYLLPFHKSYARKFVYENEIPIVNISLATPGIFSYMEKIAEKSFIIQAVGNSGTKGEVEGAVWDKCVAVGSVDSNLIPRVNSGWGKDAVDTVAIDGLDYGNGNLHGTSFSAPVVAGLLAQWYIWYKKTIGGYPGIAATNQFIKQNSQDIFEDGKDLRTGYGLLRLPKKFEGEKTVVTEGERIAYRTTYVEGEPNKIKEIDLLKESIIIDGRLMAPFRGVANALNKNTMWDPDKHQATFL